jgi:hypothetical protein
MSTKRFIKLQVQLSSRPAVFYLGAHNFVLTQDDKGIVCIDDGVHNNGGWKLAKTETYEKVVARIDKAMEEAGML